MYVYVYDLQYKRKTIFFLLGQVKMSFGQVFFIKFILYLPEWASSDKNLYVATCTRVTHAITNKILSLMKTLEQSQDFSEPL